ncbi:MAG TPA: sodium:proton antiporter [Gammaproteobacteria bacterium]|nr:sodium:proton antiporter [Gammaproteobacteria bacterium]
MTLFDMVAVLLALAAGFAYLNARLLHLPPTIGVMTLSLAFSLGVLALGPLGIVDPSDWARRTVSAIGFDRTLLDGMLSVLLFAGALQVPLDALGRQWRVVGVLATAGVVASTLLVGGAVFVLQSALGPQLPLVYCLLFGAIISPTDPVAVLGIVRRAGLPAYLQTRIAGESLFNDGVAIVVFLVIAGLTAGEAGGAAQLAGLFGREVVGGVLLGLLLGGIGYTLLRSLDEYVVEVLITLALVVGGYALALQLHCSGPLTVVVAGLLIGNHGRRFAMSQRTRERLDTFWELADELFNIVLFLLIGLEVLVIPFDPMRVLLGIAAIPVVVGARLAAVTGTLAVLSPVHEFDRGAATVLTWGGLRGGISVALALSLPGGADRDLIVTMTYVVVVFSVLVQGLTVAPLVRRLAR